MLYLVGPPLSFNYGSGILDQYFNMYRTEYGTQVRKCCPCLAKKRWTLSLYILVTHCRFFYYTVYTVYDSIHRSVKTGAFLAQTFKLNTDVLRVGKHSLRVYGYWFREFSSCFNALIRAWSPEIIASVILRYSELVS